MRKITVFSQLLMLLAVLLPASAAFAKSSTLAFIDPFTGNSCTATFNSSSSGIVNETNLICSGRQNPWANANVYYQYRPVVGGPNARCDAHGLVYTQANFPSPGGGLTSVFPAGKLYNVCVYLENPIIASGSIDVTGPEGNTTPGTPLGGQYSICVGGTYNAGLTWGDAKYLLLLDLSGWADSLPAPWDYLGSGFGEVQVNQQFVAWGAFNKQHNYCQVFTAATGDQFNLRVFDGITSESPSTRVADGWYTDNPQSDSTLQYLVTYVGQ